ncbi:MAG: histidinol-phosphate transaminase [Nitrososphaerota archaeon]|nr:histidinol-phosphate transaminase [Candidatus Bathyarchaeota archaeon]MDW8048489.1 histidinol-phosphate transaminase [Nitrososphaerota archaeon]
MTERKPGIIEDIIEECKFLESYDLGESVEILARRLNKSPRDILKLNSNENLFVPLDFLRHILHEVAEEVDPRVYPRSEIEEIREVLGRNLKVPPECIVIGAGSDQLIDLIMRMSVRCGEEILSISPTFSMYKVFSSILRANYKSVSLKDDFSLDVEKIFASFTPKTKLLILCSPNNPTANKFRLEDIDFLAENFEGLTIIDEAYVDFSDGSALSLLKNNERIIILRSFSKVFGIAGLRLGYAVASPRLAEVMIRKFQTPFPVASVAVKTCLRILNRIDVIENAVKKVKIERRRITEGLNKIEGVQAFNSETNFVLYRTGKSSSKVYRDLLKRGIIVREMGRVLSFQNCLRVTVPPSPMSDYFLSSMEEVMQQDDNE